MRVRLRGGGGPRNLLFLAEGFWAVRQRSGICLGVPESPPGALLAHLLVRLHMRTQFCMVLLVLLVPWCQWCHGQKKVCFGSNSLTHFVLCLFCVICKGIITIYQYCLHHIYSFTQQRCTYLFLISSVRTHRYATVQKKKASSCSTGLRINSTSVFMTIL